MTSKKEATKGKVVELSPEEQMELFLGKTTNITRVIHLSRFEGVDYVLKPIDGETMDAIQERATFFDKPAKRNEQPKKRVDEQMLQAGIISEGVVSPDLKKLAEHYGEVDVFRAVKRHFLAGELLFLTSEIMDLSGFNEEEAIEEVKKP